MARLHEAARAGDPDAIRRALDAGDAIDARDEEGRTALMAAAEAGQVDGLRALIAAGADLDAVAEPLDPDPKYPPTEAGAALVLRYGLIELIGPIARGEGAVKERRKDRNGPTALMIAAATDRAETVSVLIAAGASLIVRDRDGFTALSYAAALGHAGIVRALIAAGAEVDPVDHYEMTPIILAAFTGQAEAIRALAEAGASLDAPRPRMLPPLHAAAYRGHAEAVRVLLEAGADPKALALGASALERALNGGHTEVVGVLAYDGSDLDRVESTGLLAPVMIAVVRKDRASLRVLLEAGADPNGPAGPSGQLPGGATALHIAACWGDPEAVRMLLDAGADPRPRDALGYTPLMLATASGHDSAAALLRDAAPPSESDLTTLRSLALVAAVRHGDAARARALLDAGASPDTRSPKTAEYHYLLRCRSGGGYLRRSSEKGEDSPWTADRPVLSLALDLGHEEVATVLIAAGASAEGRPADEDEPGRGRTYPLIEAAEEGRAESLGRLLAAGADANVEDHTGRTLLIAASRRGDAEVVRALIAAGAEVNLEERERGETPLSLAAAGGYADAVRALLRAGARVRPEDVAHAAFGGHVEAVRALLDACRAQGVKPAAETLSRAVWSGSAELVRMLLDAGVDVDAADEGGEPALIRACHRAPELLRLLLDHGADVHIRTPEGASALSMALLYGGPEHVRLLLKHGADIEARAGGPPPGETPLILAAGRGLATMVGWHKNPEQLARVEARDDEMMHLLLEYGADIEARDLGDGRTALMYAAANGRGGAVRILLEAGAEVDAHDERYGRTALMWAAIRGQSSIVRILLEAGADAAAEDLDGDRAAELAHRSGFREIVPLLRAAEGHAPRRPGPSPGDLKVAAKAGDVEAIRALLRAGVDVNAQLAGGMTALLLAAERGRARAVAALLEAGADPNVRDREGETPLNAAIRAKSVETVRLLLRAGADPDAGGKESRGIGRETPLFLAIEDPPPEFPGAGQYEPDGQGDVESAGSAQVAIVRELIAAGASVDAPDEQGSRPLWHAFDTVQDELADLLAQAGAGREPVGAAYLRVRSLVGPARSKSFRESIRALAALCGAEPAPITSRFTPFERRNPRPGERYTAASMIGVEVSVPREQADALLAEHREAFLRRWAFLFRSGQFGHIHDVSSQRLGLLPTDDKYTVIAAMCRASSEWGWTSPGFYIRDLMAIERDHSFALIGCHSHWIELEFAAPIPHRHELARKLLAIRPQLVAPGFPEYPEFEDVVESLKARRRIGIYWE